MQAQRIDALFPTVGNAGTGLADDMDRLLDTVMGGLTGWSGLVANRPRVFPPINAWEDDGAVYIEAELPGLKTEDLEITLIGNELTISGQRPSGVAGGTGEVVEHRRERATGRFSRVVRLGPGVDPDRVSAALENGVLTITLPKTEAAKPRKIAVQAR